MAVEIHVLGRVDALVDGQPVPLRGRKERGVLAMLALSANRTVSAERLIDGLWGERPPASAGKNVQLYVSRLRKVLDKDDSGASIITHGRGYELVLPDDAVDAARFEHLVERARREGERGIADGAAKSALDLWRGAPLADVAEEPFAAPEIRRLEELHLRAIELTIDAELAAGRHGEVLGRLEALLAEHPLHERFHAQRVLALYRAGRQSEALEAYRQARQTLTEEIGIEPGSELQVLQESILRQDPALDAPAPARELPHQLEGGSPLLAGRTGELHWLRERWEEATASRCRLALISGPTGIGKTRLAAELAAGARREGATVLYASALEPPEDVLDAIGAAQASDGPTLLVLDEADDVEPALLEAAGQLATSPPDGPLLLLVLHQAELGGPALGQLERRGAAPRLALGPLDASATQEIAQLYAPGEGAAIPLDTLMAESEGVPLRIHRAAGRWAQAQATDRLQASVGRATDEKSGLRTTQAELAGSVADLQLARERSDLYLSEEPADPSAPEVCPFRGLAPFDSAQAEYFFGRERLVAELVARLVGSTLMAVVGPSGSGKSSVVRAGLLPALANGVLPGSEGWRQALMRPGEHPLSELSRALSRLAPGKSVRHGDNPLAALLSSLAPGERAVLAVDQLEEAFAACRDDVERATFFEALVAAADDPDQGVIVLLAIRADFYGRCADYPGLSARISANNVLVGPMTREELPRVIELPARRAGLRVEPQLVTALVDDVADEPGGLPLLSTALLELWQERSDRTLRHASYEASGGVKAAVARLAERAYERLSEPQRERARTIMLRLVDAEEAALVRRRVPISELEAERDEQAAEALAVLTESRLVTVDEETVEVAHEALLREWPRLRGWLEEDAEGRRLHQHLIHAAGEWQASERDPAELYRGARLASALDWAASHDPELNELERAFLEESRAASEREAERQRRTNRRLTALLAGVGVLLAAAVVAGLTALSERQGARNAATAADAQRLAAESVTADELDQALLLANTGVALDDSPATRSSLFSALERSPAALGVLNGDGDSVISLSLSPDGGMLALGDLDGTVTMFDTETRGRVGRVQAPGAVWSLSFDAGGGSLAASATDPQEAKEPLLNGRLLIIDTGSLRVRSSVAFGPHPAGRGLPYFPTAAYTPDGRSIVVDYSSGDKGWDNPVFLRRFDPRKDSLVGPAVRVAPTASSVPLLSAETGHLIEVTREATYAIDPRTLRVVRRYSVGGRAARINSDGRTLAVGDRRLSLLDLASGQVRVFGSPLEAPGAFSPDGRTLSTSHDDGSVILRDVESGATIEALEGQDGTDAQVFGADGRTLYTTNEGSNVTIWDVTGDRRLVRQFPTDTVNETPEGSPPTFAVSPDGSTLAVSRFDGRVDLIDAETLRRTGGFEAFPGRSALAIEYSPDGRRLAVAGQGGGVGIWDAGSEQRVGPFVRAPRGPLLENPRNVQAVAFGPDGQLAAAGVGGEVRIWDLDSRTLTGPPLQLPPFVVGLAFSPDGAQLAIPFGVSHPGPSGVEVRDPATGERVARLRSDNEVRSVTFSPDGRLLAGGQVNGSTLLWATDGWRPVGQSLGLGDNQTSGVAFSPDGRTLATSYDDATVQLWDVASQQPIGTPLPGPGGWAAARFTPDGRRLFAVYDSGSATRWEVDPGVWVQHACAVAGGLTPEQWAEIVPEQEYRAVCPSG